MSRYVPPQGSQTASQPGSHGRVLCNMRGITRVRVMDATEHTALMEQQFRYYHELIRTETSFQPS